MKKEMLVPVRIDALLKEKAIKKADSLSLSLSSYVRSLIAKDLQS